MANQIKLQLLSKIVRLKGKAPFRTYWTTMNIALPDGTKAVKSITVKFRKNVNTFNLKRGTLICNESDVNAPFVYEVKEKEDGTKEYPTIWIRGYINYIEKLSSHTQNDFVIDEEETDEIELSEVK